jgi:hypothetical protein
MMLEKSKQSYVSPIAIAAVYARLDENNKAFEWLEKAYQERSSRVVYLKVNLDFDSLRSDLRFTDLMRRVGLAQ